MKNLDFLKFWKGEFWFPKYKCDMCGTKLTYLGAGFYTCEEHNNLMRLL